jgi:hypothetical protein
MRVDERPRGLVLARAHGAFLVVSGLWPLLHRRSFEAVLGPKRDYWLVATVGLLLAGNGSMQVTAPPTTSGVASARQIGTATSAALAGVDLVNVGRGRISRMYLVDAAVQLAWLYAWTRATGRSPARPDD